MKTIINTILFFMATTIMNAQSQPRTGYITNNGVKYYYSIQGQGEPLLILHGGLGQFEMFEPVMPILTKNRQVIGVDLQGHGRTSLGDSKFSLMDMGDDMAAILKRSEEHTSE